MKKKKISTHAKSGGNEVENYGGVKIKSQGDVDS